MVPGESIEINPIKGPSSYLIPSGTSSKTGFPIKKNQWVLGLYTNSKTTITCTRPCPPATCTTTVSLDTITMYGNSKN
jgi:hypothetical protein